MPDQVKYDLESVKLPRLAGGLLKVFIALLENPGIRGYIMPLPIKRV